MSGMGRLPATGKSGISGHQVFLGSKKIVGGEGNWEMNTFLS
jgi:hypothetical protein